MTKQVKFIDLRDETIHGGILMDNGDCISAKDGHVFEKSNKNITWELICVYNSWMNFDEGIIGGYDV